MMLLKHTSRKRFFFFYGTFFCALSLSLAVLHTSACNFCGAEMYNVLWFSAYGYREQNNYKISGCGNTVTQLHFLRFRLVGSNLPLHQCNILTDVSFVSYSHEQKCRIFVKSPPCRKLYPKRYISWYKGMQ